MLGGVCVCGWVGWGGVGGGGGAWPGAGPTSTMCRAQSAQHPARRPRCHSIVAATRTQQTRIRVPCLALPALTGCNGPGRAPRNRQRRQVSGKATRARVGRCRSCRRPFAFRPTVPVAHADGRTASHPLLLPSRRSYNSEEERYAARRQGAERCAALRTEQAAQAHILQGFRARQEQQQQLVAAAFAAKVRQQTGPASNAWDPAPPVGPAGCAGNDSQRSWIRELQHHERCWETLLQRPGRRNSLLTERQGIAPDARALSLGFTDVPWPPLECAAYLQGLAHLERQQHGQGDGQRRAARRAYARACRRWHPDKFAARWGPLLAPADRAAILQQVQQISQGINMAWEVLRRECEAGIDGQ